VTASTPLATETQTESDIEPPSLSERIYVRWLIVIVTITFRTWLGARGSFTGDDFEFRSMTSGPLSWDVLFTGHNGHLNPVGLLLQWLTQRVFPGMYVPLMTISAALVAVAQAFVGMWARIIFGPRWIGLFAAGFTGLSLMGLELATWWSVALYAAPLLAFTAILIWASTRYFLSQTSLHLPLTVSALCLLSSSKAVLLPLLILSLAAAYPLGVQSPLGFRRALSVHRRLWAGMSALLVLYLIVFALRRGPIVTADPSPEQVWDFVWRLIHSTVLPTLWGGPWNWGVAPMGFHTSPNTPAILVSLAGVITLLAIVAILVVRPLVWRMLLGSGLYVLSSSLLVAVGRAGSPFGAPVLRYTFDFVLPIVLVLSLGLAATRWESGPRTRSAAGLMRWRTLHPRLARIAVTCLIGLWLISTTVSYLRPWQVLPNVSMKTWVDTVRTSYPEVGSGLLEQSAPAPVAFLPTPLNTFLAGDPDAPAETDFVTDRLLGYDDQGRLISQNVLGVRSVPPEEDCADRSADAQPATVDLEDTVPAGRHTVVLEYLLSTASRTSVALDSTATEGLLPPGARRAFFVVEGGGANVRVTTTNPAATLCVLSVTVGAIVPGPPVHESGE
jgi:hypothetical protein